MKNYLIFILLLIIFTPLYCNFNKKCVHMATYPMLECNDALIVFAFQNQQDSILFVVVNSFEDKYPFAKRYSTLSEFISKNNLPETNILDYQLLQKNETRILNLSEYTSYTPYRDYVLRINLRSELYQMNKQIFYTTDDIKLYNRELYIKK